MTDILQIFTGNPLTTFIGKKIEAATRPDLETDDWALNLEICDIINDSDDDAKDAARSIRKRLQQVEQDKNFEVTNRTLTVLETCVSNCSHRFHVLVMTKDFIQDLVKLIGPKNNPPIALQERVLRMIERWSEAFRSQPELQGVVTIYNELKAKGVTFPPADIGPNVPIQTPRRSVPPPVAEPNRFNPSTSSREPQSIYQSQSGPIVLEGEGYEKITRDLQVVRNSIEMFTEIIQMIERKSPDVDWKLAADLGSTCNLMKERIVDLIERIANEDLTIELLRLNDEIINIFARYDRAKKLNFKSGNQDDPPKYANDPSPSESRQHARPTSSNNSHAAESNNPDSELSLIDFGAEDPSGLRSSGSEKPQVSEVKPKSSRTDELASDISRLSLNTKATNKDIQNSDTIPKEISNLREEDFAEIENWLSNDPSAALPDSKLKDNSSGPTSMTNSEFDKFIASRASGAGSSRTQATDQPQDKSGNIN